MSASNDTNHTLLPAESIARTKKEKYLLNFTEDDFRNFLIRPLFERRGLQFNRDTCGIDEQGKDCIFTVHDALGTRMVYAVQTKKGPVNMTRHNKENAVIAATQLEMALKTEISFSATKDKQHPDVVILCCSGRINESARDYIVEKVSDPRIRFIDSQDLIPDIDKLFPEFWYGIDADKFPYLNKLREELLNSSDVIIVHDINSSSSASTYTPITDDSYVTLYLSRVKTEVKKSHGQITRVPKLEEVKAQHVLSVTESLILIIGEGGSGKTTALRRIAHEIVDKSLSSKTDIKIPIFLKASDLSKSPNTLLENMSDATKKIVSSDTVSFSQKDLSEGNVTVMVDAIDESHSNAGRKELLNKILEFHDLYPKCKVICTSRDYSYIRTMPETKRFAQYRISPIEIKQATQIVERVSKGKTLSAEVVQETLRQIQDVHGMSLSPLLVTIFVASSDFNKKDVPPNITEIFKKFTEMMLGRWDERKGISHQYQSNLKDFLLQKLAFLMHIQQERIVSLEECRKIISAELDERGYSADIDTLFDEIVYRSGILSVEDNEVSFKHHLFQEFFAGRGIPDTSELPGIVYEEWWRKAIVFYYGDNPADYRSLQSLTQSISHLSSLKKYDSAVTIGLAIQACYLSKVNEKENIMRWVVSMLSDTCEDCVGFFTEKMGYPLTSFIAYSIYARDSVASDIMSTTYKNIISEISEDENINDLRTFWCIIGLLESGHVDAAKELVNKFNPKDKRILLSLHICSFYIWQQRISPPYNKKVAEDICKKIMPKIEGLTGQVLKETRGYLLEMQRGDVIALDAPRDEEEIEEENEIGIA